MATRKLINQQKQKQNRTNAILYGLSGLFVLIAAIVITVQRAQASVHPTPRAEAAQALLMSPDRYADTPEIAETYKMAADLRSTIDGLFCYCYCKGGGHYSLLDCFKDDHGAGCDICLESVQIAHRMTQEGKTLDQIRAQLDTQFGEGHSDG
jgi:hypothetical protein